MFHFLVDIVQFFPFYSVMTAWLPDKSVDGKLEVVKGMLKDVSNSMDREGCIEGSEVHNGFRDDPIKNPGDREKGKTILQVIEPGCPVGT